MSGRVEIRSGSARRVRWLARAPRIALALVAGILALAGLRAAVAGPPAPVGALRTTAPVDLPAQGFAEAFARAYLTWDASRPERHERLVGGFLADSLEPGAGLVPPARGREEVRWSAAVQEGRTGRRSLAVTVAVQTTQRLAYVVVPVGRDGRGFLFVSGYPALVGGPAVAKGAAAREEEELEDPRVRAVVERALRNYLAREPADLRADLAPEAVVSLPLEPLLVRSIDEVRRARPGLVACVVSATDRRGVDLTLRYELSVVRRDRFYVRSIAADPRKGGFR